MLTRKRKFFIYGFLVLLSLGSLFYTSMEDYQKERLSQLISDTLQAMELAM